VIDNGLAKLIAFVPRILGADHVWEAPTRDAALLVRALIAGEFRSGYDALSKRSARFSAVIQKLTAPARCGWPRPSRKDQKFGWKWSAVVHAEAMGSEPRG
jgi:hypothetical protein